MPGPTPDLNLLTVTWEGTLDDGSVPQGTMLVEWLGGHRFDSNAVHPLSVLPTNLTANIQAITEGITDKDGIARITAYGRTTVQVPASNDPDIIYAAGSRDYRCTLTFSNGKTRSLAFNFYADVDAAGGLINLAQILADGGSTGEGAGPISVVTVARVDAIDARVTALEGEAVVTSVAGVSPDGTGNVALTKSNVGLGNVTNTSDANKPVSTAQQTALNAKADLVGGVVPSSQLPSLVINNTFVVASQAAMLATGANKGDIAKRTDVVKTFILSATPASTLGNWVDISTSGTVDSVAGRTGTVVLDKTDVGLANVDNTSDANKPISTATQAALDTLTTSVGAKLTVTGTKTAGFVPKVQGDLSVAWAADSAGTGGGSGAIGDQVLYVYASGETGATGSYICDGTSDQVQINAALAALSNSGAQGDTISFGTVGGTVVLVGRRFNIDGPILMRTQTRLTSMYGEFGTEIRCTSPYAPGNTGGMIQLFTTNVQYVTVDNLILNGQGRQTCGLYINVGAGQEYDSYLKFHDLYIWNCGGTSGIGDGISMQNNSGGRLRGNHLSGIRVINAGRYGCYVNGPDSFYERIDCGSSGNHGFFVTHANNRFVNCKSWFSDGAGFYTSTASRDNQFSACEAQDNLRHGYEIQGARNSFSSCCADSNSFDGSGSTAITGRTFHGFYVNGNYTNVHGTASDKNEGGRGARQVYGVYINTGITCLVNVMTTGNFTGALSDNSAATRVVNVIGS